jgi:hypothetical protein
VAVLKNLWRLNMTGPQWTSFIVRTKQPFVQACFFSQGERA